MSIQKPCGDGQSLVDDWNFSTETVFRISKLLEDFRHEFGRTQPTSVLARLTTRANQPLDLDFVRRVFTDPKQDSVLETVAEEQSDNQPNIYGAKKTPLCFQFTGSSVFEDFRRSKDLETLRFAFDEAMKLMRMMLPSGDIRDVCLSIKSLYEKAYENTNLLGILELLENTASKLNDIPTGDVSGHEKFQLLSLLFVFYSRINIAGEASATVSAAHFSSTESDVNPSSGRPRVFAYLLEADPKSGTDHTLLRIDSDGGVHSILSEPSVRSHPVFFPDSEGLIDTKVQQSIRSLFLFECYKIFNPFPPTTNHLYHLVIPVYEVDDTSRFNPAENNHIVTGPFLGWLYALLDEKALKALLEVSISESWEDKWSHLREHGGKFSKSFIRDLQQLRFGLNRFSELYLLGEMEWAIEQPWMNASNAACFTARHYHHCDGWLEDNKLIGKVDISDQALTAILGDNYSSFLKLDESAEKFAIASPTDPIHEVTHVVVDVGRSFSIDERGSGRPVPILFRRRKTTALPMQPTDRDYYLGRLTGNIRNFYDMAKMREGERMAGNIAGSLEHAEAVHEAISHEFKKILPLIEEAPPFVLPQISRWLLAYSLPGLAHLEQMQDSMNIPTEVQSQEGDDYHQWVSGLIRMSAEMETIVQPASSCFLPTNEPEWRERVESVVGRFKLDKSLRDHQVPDDFEVRCLLGAALLCVIRNTIKSTFDYEAGTCAATGKTSYGSLKFNTAFGSHVDISVQRDSLQRWGWGLLLITNKADENSKPQGKRSGGTEGSVNFYLNGIRKTLGLTNAFIYKVPHTPKNNTHVSKLPLIEPKQEPSKQ